MQVVVNISDKFIEDQLISGFDFGIGYWCSEVKGWNTGKLTKEKIFVRVDNVDKSDKYAGQYFGLDLSRAIQLSIEKYPHLLDPYKMDALTGDMFIQLAAFGEIRYG